MAPVSRSRGIIQFLVGYDLGPSYPRILWKTTDDLLCRSDWAAVGELLGGPAKTQISGSTPRVYDSV